jgi:hypothetical protein
LKDVEFSKVEVVNVEEFEKAFFFAKNLKHYTFF